ncbi:hypothetical protein PILCRDRAFT_377721 [Piloderma croceum F 1598]|uniref:Uncharacterized protein n=1 Tax=Piloderma croceum (strain F 1598) TaxID=765440 RepID=A0A0C3FLN3_PILCF|nr:hypothetical protein PILCRDRAFT_377721 [Piloderma croceum F 1598]
MLIQLSVVEPVPTYPPQMSIHTSTTSAGQYKLKGKHYANEGRSTNAKYGHTDAERLTQGEPGEGASAGDPGAARQRIEYRWRTWNGLLSRPLVHSVSLPGQLVLDDCHEQRKRLHTSTRVSA